MNPELIQLEYNDRKIPTKFISEENMDEDTSIQIKISLNVIIVVIQQSIEQKSNDLMEQLRYFQLLFKIYYHSKTLFHSYRCIDSENLSYQFKFGYVLDINQIVTQFLISLQQQFVQTIAIYNTQQTYLILCFGNINLLEQQYYWILQVIIAQKIIRSIKSAKELRKQFRLMRFYIVKQYQVKKKFQKLRTIKKEFIIDFILKVIS
ncbi:unnamed protein product (macronuclear) [Paramecium tetraurelia]|uniref:Transmembrane protein n=1 Tax=Paramecium tetraurelia TaxID=5888 RepID=A0DJW6_PARTE|nr:uncharacterized protein GSPATT00017677001 [Paramecium tetraurelia]CAK83333.1 unnamed protein product [Paramecium tetraurelia]|eukprot:XP_001450730.1 hypothetical protein (macronuclear) [Paramecium tetraurelia strain d4-2]